MNIQLPDKFFYSSDWDRFAYVDDGVLYVNGDVNYENLMYSLAYAISGYQQCFYCGKRLTKETRTLDHMYPRCWGGISIPDNLVPSCSMCNSQKSNLIYYQFEKWRDLKVDKRPKAYARFIKENEKEIKSHYLLPAEWITSFEVSEVVNEIDFSVIECFGNEKIELYYKLHHCYPRPIIVSSNNWVFKGKHILYHAKCHDIKTVSCVRLENVVRIKK